VTRADEQVTSDGFDYIVVGSGAGGGPLAANLAEAGMRVLLLEAGGEDENEDYRVPSFHAAATENAALRWDFFVKHYGEPTLQERDSKYVPGKGILYPRSGTLGGCSAHNAMITIYPHNRDWDDLAALLGDRSWRSGAMRRYFERLERCNYRRRPLVLPRNRLLATLLASLPLVSDKYVNRGRHGFDGWLTTNLADPKLVTRDPQLLAVLLAAAESSLADFLGRPLSPLEGLGTLVDPNDWRVQAKAPQGLWLVPIATSGGRRASTRDRIRDVQHRLPERLVVRTGALVTRVLIDDAGAAVGVEYCDEAHLYRADPASRSGPLPPTRHVRATREVVLCAGAFNTPQLLMLSGIGPADELRRHGLSVRADRPGVGANLQDRYDIGVVTEIDEEFALIRDCTFKAPEPGEDPDPCYREWQRGQGVYTTNGVLVGVIRKSRRDLPVPDLFIFGLVADFHGYYPGYASELRRNRTRFTWAILKAHTRNNAGRVRLRSADPRDMPDVNFHYFAEGTDPAGEDLGAVATGIGMARDMNRRASEVIERELLPGDHVSGQQQIRDYVRAEAWGHHASGTCKLGRPEDPMAVVDSRFRVYGVRHLRVVDASVFPRIPGFFIATPVYMISEKASDVILADAARTPHRFGPLRRASVPDTGTVGVAPGIETARRRARS